MSFEEHLRRTFGTVADRLRDEITRELNLTADDLTQVARAEQAANEDRAARDARAVVEEEMSQRLAASVAAAEERERASGVHELEQAAARHEAEDFAAGQRLLDAVRAIDRSRSLSEILMTLASGSAAEASRVAVFVVKGNELRGWQFTGFGPALDGARDFESSLEDSGILGVAIRKGDAVLRIASASVHPPSFAELRIGRPMVAIPLAVSGHVVAVLYADQGSEGPVHSPWAAVVEVLARHAARTLEVITAFRVAQARGGGVVLSPQSSGTSQSSVNSRQSDSTGVE